MTDTEIVLSPSSLAVIKLCSPVRGLALALQVKLVLSNVISGDKVRVLINDGMEPERGEIVTRRSLLDKGVVPFSQVMSMVVTETGLSVAGLREMVQVRVRGVVLPAYSGPGGTVMLTSGVETGEEKIRTNCFTREISAIQCCSIVSHLLTKTVPTVLCISRTVKEARYFAARKKN